MAVRRFSRRRSERTPSLKASAAGKRKLILDAAVKVFARKGYYGCRVSDIADEAKVAYGLVYHYFKSKEDVLNSIFQERWTVFIELLRQLEKLEAPLADKLTRIAGALLDAYRLNPEMMEVVIMEIARNAKFFDKANIDLFTQAMGVIERMMAREAAEGHLRRSVPPRVAAYLFFSSIEALLTGFVVGAFTARSPGEQAHLRDQVVEVFLKGIQA
ncbi:MAG: TetR/AcrR family transcriptional regulator [Bdellovibrionota bacterium]